MIPILKKYIGREYIKILFSSLVFIIILFHIVDLVDHLDNFYAHGAENRVILKFYLLKTPEHFVAFLPFAILISAVILLVIRSRFNETIAIFASGISLFDLIGPILLISAAAASLSFLTSEIIVPWSSSGARDIEANYIRKKEKAARFFQNRYWLKVRDGLIVAHVLDEQRQRALGFTYLFLDETGNLMRRVDAREAVYNGAWELKNVEIIDLEERVKIRGMKEMTLEIPANFDTFFSSQKSPSDMNSRELGRYIKEIRIKGYDVQAYLVDYHSRFSYLFLNVIIVFLAAPFSIIGPRKAALVTSVLVSVIVGFACWVLFSIFVATGRKGILDPVVASWAPDIIIGAAAFLVYRKTRL